jgi:hypothetical protein
MISGFRRFSSAIGDFGGFVGKCLAQAFQHSWATVGNLSTIASIALPMVLFYLSDSKPTWAEKVNDLVWQIPLCITAAIVLARLLLSPFWVYQETRREIGELKEQIKQAEVIFTKPKLKLDLQFHQSTGTGYMGEDAGKVWPITHDFTVTIANVGRDVCIAKIVVSYEVPDNGEHVLPSSEPHLVLPQQLATNRAMHQPYRLQPGHFDHFLSWSPRLTVKTACGSIFTLGPTAFKEMKTRDGVAWDKAIIRDKQSR